MIKELVAYYIKTQIANHNLIDWITFFVFMCVLGYCIFRILCFISNRFFYKTIGTLKIDTKGSKDKYCIEIGIPFDELPKYRKVVLKIDANADLS